MNKTETNRFNKLYQRHLRLLKLQGELTRLNQLEEAIHVQEESKRVAQLVNSLSGDILGTAMPKFLGFHRRVTAAVLLRQRVVERFHVLANFCMIRIHRLLLHRENGNKLPCQLNLFKKIGKLFIGRP